VLKATRPGHAGARVASVEDARAMTKRGTRLFFILCTWGSALAFVDLAMTAIDGSRR
jgi:hypothetical protein